MVFERVFTEASSLLHFKKNNSSVVITLLFARAVKLFSLLRREKINYHWFFSKLLLPWTNPYALPKSNGPVEVAHTSELKRQNQENQKFEASLGCPFKKIISSYWRWIRKMVKARSQGGPEKDDVSRTWKDYYTHELTAAVPAQNPPQTKPVSTGGARSH